MNSDRVKFSSKTHSPYSSNIVSAQEPDFCTQINMISALAFLPVDGVSSGWNSIRNKFDDIPLFQTYFEETYLLGRMHGATQRRGPPLFPATVWNVSSRTEQGLPRTTNAIESWHNRLKVLLGASHVGLVTFLEQLRKKEHAITLMIARSRTLANGISPSHVLPNPNPTLT